MKFLETHYDDYIQCIYKQSLHPSFEKIFTNYPTDINSLCNIIFYGPSGVGKYTQMLHSIKKYSPSSLKYEKKMTLVHNKNDYYLKISDIHFEVDMALLGCNSKLLWNDIFINIHDVLSARINKTGIIVCKNFHKISNDLLECFYSYIQQHDANIKIIYIFLSEIISFIPDSIINTFNIISVPRPSKKAYNKILDKRLPSKIELNTITNIKNVITNTNSIIENHNIYTDKLYNLMCNSNDIKFINFRDILYDILIYDIEIGYIVWKLLYKLHDNNNIKTVDDISYIYIETHTFLQYYNNNYRPIYHIENYLYKIINKIHGF